MDELSSTAATFQKDCHETVEMIFDRKKERVQYQDATNVWIFRKLAELQVQISELNKIS